MPTLQKHLKTDDNDSHVTLEIKNGSSKTLA